MGKRGPKPKPTALRVLEGNPGRLPINPDQPVPSGEAECPEHLSNDARAVWGQIVAAMPPGFYTPADAPLLAAFAESWATHKAAAEGLRRDRDLFGARLVHDERASAYVRIMAEAARTMASLATRLGLSPADRVGLKATGNPERTSKWAGLIS